MDRLIVIHGHFYQPPRENPWLGIVEREPGAAPFHDWNSRIAAECYLPNTRARILDAQGHVVRSLNNYEWISHDFGPTLMEWLEAAQPALYTAIIDADRASAGRFQGHGSAIAHAYNHMIMPLANSRDKRTQVLWGIRDFEHRYGRPPAGMWLPETAVDMETLDIMAAAGIKFTILEPSQAARVRPAGSEQWHDIGVTRTDTRKPYFVRLPSERTIAVFLYDGPASRAVAFEGLLNDGTNLAERLLAGFDDGPGSQLVHIATDGESYGHHHQFGEMALAKAIDIISRGSEARLANYASFLASHPPTDEAEILDGTSWSCTHGVERWRADCGCNTGEHPGWNQAWRVPLREALEWLRDEIDWRYEERASRYFADPWRARDEYISVLLQGDTEPVPRFLEAAGGNPEAWPAAGPLLEQQKFAMLMFTSCGWFFDDISGIESAQVLRYAGRVIELARELLSVDLAPRFQDILSRAVSNVPGSGTGADVYHAAVRTSRAGG
jgi:alpha-amylase/alpha-mannosidase (GH57 family)